MGREINLAAGNRLNLRDAVSLSHADFHILAVAYERYERSAQVGGCAVTLDSVVEIAAEAGYNGTMDQAGNILKLEGGFIIEPGPSERLTVRQPDSPADSFMGNSAQG